jgi:uncharacterized protein (DUF1800 family)
MHALRTGIGIRWRRAAAAGGLALAILVLWVPARAAAAPTAFAARTAAREQQLVLAGHLLRRLGFGPNRQEMHEVLRLGIPAYIDLQLHPERIDDRVGERDFHPVPKRSDEPSTWQLRWLTRMAFSRRQLQEKMTLLWHEHFATSVGKVTLYTLMRDQERFLRANALGSFRQLLIGITTDNAMLIYLDNNNNDGQRLDALGNRIPPNENYARELLQLFSVGANRLNMDGTLVLDPEGKPVPAYSETDVKEVARALTGWSAHRPRRINPEIPTEYIPPAGFDPSAHDPGQKIVMGEVIPAGDDNQAADVERIVDVIMRQPSTAPFIAKELILKLATETPSPGYVERVATVFANSGGDIRATVGAILTDDEFYSPEVVRTQYKEPIEHIVGALRGLGGKSRGNTLYYWTSQAGQLVYNPPSVFSFYRPGHKSSLVNTAYVSVRDQATEMVANSYVDRYFDASWDAPGYIRRLRLAQRPGRAVDLLAHDLLAAPLTPEMRQVLLDYVGPQVTEEKLRGAAWLIMCSPEYQAN